MELENTLSLKGMKAVVLGIANQDSIAYGCAKAFRVMGADLAISYLNEKSKAFVAPIAEELEAEIFLPCDVQHETQMATLFTEIENRWGRLDIGLHAIAYAPRQDLQGRLVDSSSEGFSMAMDISCHSFMRMARFCEPLMTDGGTLFTMSFHGSQKVVKNYNLMGPIKAALESSVRYLAYELGPREIRVHAISPGPVKTRAASGLKAFDDLINDTALRAPIHQMASIEDVGMAAAVLATPSAKIITGETIYIDGGSNIMA